MKNIQKIALLTLILSFLIVVSCDRIEQPIPAKSGGLDWSLFPDGDSAEYNWPTWNQNTNTLQNVLLEDFTGHTCTNCPPAATIAKDLENLNPDRVFVASIHASVGNSFQAVEPPEFTIDYTTEHGDRYANEIPSFFGNPSGTINRQGGGLGNTIWFLSSSWNNTTNTTLGQTPMANLQVQTNYYPETRGLFIHTESEFLSSLSDDYALVIYLIRKKTISPQKLPNGSTELEYEHHNVMSNVINGTWGTTIATNPTSGDKLYNNFAVELPDNLSDTTYNISNLSLITYVYNKNTYEVLQVIGSDI